MKVTRNIKYNESLELIHIEYHDAETGEHVIDAVWDDRDEQTKEKQEAFIEWADRHMADRGDEVL